jgi:glycosyltransferase involved in cell wall biosynthesis
MKKPFFSIITVVKNDEKNIEKTINSIRHQSYKNFEYIIVDGKSKDQTLIKIKKMKKFINKFISEKDKGIYDAMNKGIKMSKGKVIVFCNSGDIFFPAALKIVKKIFNKKIDFVFGTVKRNYLTKSIIKSGFNKNRIYYNFDFATCHSTGFFLKKKVYNEIGFYDQNFKCSADYDLYLRMIKSKKYIGSYTKKSEIIGEVSSGGYSSTFNILERIKEEINIRLKNKQNKLWIFVVYLNTIIKNPKKVINAIKIKKKIF